jgi:RNA polymerase sigma-70 factor (ECF subfamily)
VSVDLAGHRPELVAYLARRTGDRQAAEDLAQDTLVRALTGLHRFTDRGDGIRPWLFTIARNVAVDHHRAARRRPVPAEVEQLERRLPAAGDPADAVALRETVRTALATLTGRQRAVVEARFLAGLPVQEAAARLGCSTRAVVAATHKALRALGCDPQLVALA